MSPVAQTQTQSRSVVSYETTWGSIELLIREKIAQNIRDPLTIVNSIEKTMISRHNKMNVNSLVRKIFQMSRDDFPDGFYRLGVLGEKYVPMPHTIVDDSLIDTVVQQISDNTDYVIELGGGYGRQMIRVIRSLSDGHSGLGFCVGEPSQKGRRCIGLLNSLLDEERNIRAFYFDYLEPDFSFIEKRKNVVFFTSSSIEQVKFVGGKVFDLMLEATDSCTCIHMEPVGFQRSERLVARAAHGKLPSLDKKLRFKDKYLNYNAARYSQTANYNLDLLSVLNNLESQGRIKKSVARYNCFGYSSFTPLTLLVWQKV